MADIKPRYVTATITAAAAGDYSANDVVSESATGDAGRAKQLSNVVSRAGQVAWLDAISVVCSEDSILARMRVHFYNYSPAAADVEMDDNVAFDFAKTSTGAAGYLGYVDLPAFEDRGTAMSHTQAVNVRQFFKCLSTSQSLYILPEWRDAEANETANMTLRFDTYWLDA